MLKVYQSYHWVACCPKIHDPLARSIFLQFKTHRFSQQRKTKIGFSVSFSFLLFASQYLTVPVGHNSRSDKDLDGGEFRGCSLQSSIIQLIDTAAEHKQSVPKIACHHYNTLNTCVQSWSEFSQQQNQPRSPQQVFSNTFIK